MPVADAGARTSCEVLPTTECCPYLVSIGLFFFREFKYKAGVLAQRSNQPLGVTPIDTAVVGHSKKMRVPGFWTVWLQSCLYNNQVFTAWLKPNHRHWEACYHHINFLYQDISTICMASNANYGNTLPNKMAMLWPTVKINIIGPVKPRSVIMVNHTWMINSKHFLFWILAINQMPIPNNR